MSELFKAVLGDSMRSINPVNNNGSIQLRFSVNKKRYSFSPIPGGDYSNKLDLQVALSIAKKIELDILTNNFDPTLEKYKPRKTEELIKESKEKYLLPVWDLWVAQLDISEVAKADHYKWTRIQMVKANPLITESNWLLKSDLATATIRVRLSLVRSCYKWGIEKGLIDINPFSSRKKILGRKAKEIKPFTKEEIKRITNYFDEFIPEYSSFVKVLFLTGLRISECIGLHWSHVDFERGEIEISESMPINRLGNGYKRIRKETKTGNIRTLKMNAALRAALLSRIKKKGDELVFTTPSGNPIDCSHFRERVWKKALIRLNIKHRKIHTIRHTLLSHAIESGMPITQVSFIAGHKDSRMVMQTYGHVINSPDLPDLGI